MNILLSLLRILPISQVATPTALPPVSGNQYAETISAFSNLSIGMAALFVLALFGIGVIVYVYYNRNKGQGEQSLLITFSQAMGSTLKDREERIDKLEADQAKREERYNEGVMAVGDGMNRIADVMQLMQKDKAANDRVLADATSAITAIVTVGSKPLQQVVKDVGALQETSVDIQKVVGEFYKKFLLVFPSDESLDARFEALKQAMIKMIDDACEKAKHDTGDITVVSVSNGKEEPKDDQLKAG